MKTLTRMILLLGALQASQAVRAAETLSLSSARQLNDELLDFPRRNLVYGRLAETRPSDASYLGTASRLLDKYLPGGPFRVVELNAGLDEVKIVFRGAGSQVSRRLTAKRTKPAANSGTRTRSTVFREATSLVLEDRLSWRGGDGSFVTMTYAEGSRFEERLEAGRGVGPFTFAVFARKAESTYSTQAAGVAVTARFELGHGWSFAVRGEASQVEDRRLQISEGRLRPDYSTHPEGNLRLEVRKAFEGGYSVSGGAKIRFAGDAGFDQRGCREVFVAIGKTLTNSRGESLGRIEISGVREVDGAEGVWGVFVGFSRSF